MAKKRIPYWGTPSFKRIFLRRFYCFNYHPRQPEPSEEDPHDEVSDKSKHNCSFLGFIPFIIGGVISAKKNERLV